MSGNWASDDTATDHVTVGGAGDEMEDRRQPEDDLAKVLAALERERTAAADLNSALIASESRVASLERRLRDGEVGTAALDELRSRLAEQSELAEQYRIEAAEAQTMFDAMQHRIETLSAQVAALKEAATPGPDAASSPALEEARAEVARLAGQLAERETALAATRRARDQWLERLEQSGRERERLRDRLVEREKSLAALESAAADVQRAERRARDLEEEIAALRAESLERAQVSAAERAADAERLRAELRQTEEVWERAESEKESLAEELAAARLRIDELEGAAAGEHAVPVEPEALERLRQDTARLESEREELRRENAEMRAQLERVETALVEQAAAREDLQQELGAAQARAEAAAGDRAAALAEDLEQWRERSAVLEGQVESLRSEREEALARLRALEERLAEMQRNAENASEGASAVDAERRAALEELAAVRAEAERRLRRADELEEAHRLVSDQLAAANGEREGLVAEMAQRDEATAALSAKIGEAAALQQQAEGEQSRLIEQASRLGDEVEGLKELMAEARREMSAEGELVGALEGRFGDGIALRAELDDVRGRYAELERAQYAATATNEEAAHRQAQLDGEVERLHALLRDLQAERDSLNATAEIRRQAEEALRAEVERLTAASVEEGARAAELQELRHRVEELEAERERLVRGHSSEVREYRAELAQQVEVIGEREGELDRLVRECSSLQHAVDEAIGELEGMRGERENLREPGRSADETAPEDLAGLEDLEAIVSAAETDERDVEDDIEEVSKLAAEVVPISAVDSSGAPFVLHFDGLQECRVAIEDAVAKVRGARVSAESEVEVPSDMRPVLAFNLATDAVNPLATLTEASRWGIDPPRGIVYCVKGDRGVFFGRVEFFPAPCDPKECAHRLLERSDGDLQRLLVVGEEVDLMSGLREEMGRNRCSTAIAFDGRQAVDLIPMVKPQIVLVDLNLPRGDGLRVASQIRSNPETGNLSVAMFWNKPIDPLVFRQQAIYAMRDFTLSQQELTRKFADALHRFDDPIVGGGQKSGARRGRAASSQ